MPARTQILELRRSLHSGRTFYLHCRIFQENHLNYTVPALLKGKEYRAVMDLIMTGPWNIITRARVQGKWVRVVFPIDVR